MGATVLILHHTGKTITSQDYRGSSDIKATVDMAYCLESELTLAGGIYRLTLRNFKGRFAPGQHLGLEFVRRKGFIACEVPNQVAAADPLQTIIEIVTAHPGSNQSQIVALAQQAGIGKHIQRQSEASQYFSQGRRQNSHDSHRVTRMAKVTASREQ